MPVITKTNKLFIIFCLTGILLSYNNCSNFKTDSSAMSELGSLEDPMDQGNSSGQEPPSTQPIPVDPISSLPDDDSLKPGEVVLRKSIKRHAITWTFDKEYQVTRFINGDYAVIAGNGTVIVNSVSPVPANGQNGSGVNIAKRTQPAEISALGYVPSVSYPVVLKAGDSLVSFASILPSDLIPEGQNCAGKVYNQGGYCDKDSRVKDASVLTVVQTNPGPYTFRPSPLGESTNRRLYKLENIDQIVSQLPQLEMVDMPAIETYIRAKERFQFEAVGSWQRRYSAPTNNQATYQAYSKDAGIMLALAAKMSLEHKRALFIGVLQHGIDLEGAARIGGFQEYADGGHGLYGLALMAIASHFLGDETFRNFASTIKGSEKYHTYFNSSQVGMFGKDCSGGGSADNFNYYCVLNTSPPKGSKDCRDPNGVYDQLNKPAHINVCVVYQDLVSPYYAGQALAMELLGARKIFNHEEFFKYTERWMNIKKSCKPSFVCAAWEKYWLK